MIGTRREHTYAEWTLQLTIGPNPFYDLVVRIGPKSRGGGYWKASKEYSACLERPEWRNLGYSEGLNPCTVYAWLGPLVKSVRREYLVIATKLQLMGAVDYVLDELEENKGSFQTDFQAAAQLACAPGSLVQGPALASLINYDFQDWVWKVHRSWSIKNQGPFNLGPEETWAEDGAAIMVGDCAAIVPWAFESAEVYNSSRISMMIGSMQTTCFDIIFDTGCSNHGFLFFFFFFFFPFFHSPTNPPHECLNST